ncbi:hypothetical protein A2U01_0119230, partial [Trifolium medium]|nr:hypothetical protein [Trifolium medium]
QGSSTTFGALPDEKSQTYTRTMGEPSQNVNIPARQDFAPATLK